MALNLGTYYDNFISKAVISGRYGSTDDVVRKALILLDMEEQKMAALRNELSIGEASPMVEDFDSQNFLEQIHKKYL
ncbi:MAG: type II toxin-antitoxin system ParD family antitoxin [Tannerella sp.]|jgi:putative addiction module CopG family antidote|nr:type II toxin-antitoxin system ParD family antitoxin [Tannerella sp.]